MVSNASRLLRQPLFLTCLAAGLLAVVVQSGELGSADTMHRLQTTHSFWTSEPPVFPSEYPEFGIYGRGGKLYDWYGMGQSLLMLPADMVGTFLQRLPLFAPYDGNDPSIRNIVVTYSVNTFINFLTALVCFRFLRLLQFNVKQSVAGVLGLLFCTTHLHYTQNMMENNYIMLLTLTGFAFQYEWLLTSSSPALMIGSAALGLNLLTRLTTSLDLLAVGAFLLLVSWLQRAENRMIWDRACAYATIALPCYSFFLLVDRLYQYYRFGSFFHTYVYYFALKYHQLDPSLPPEYPFETPFRVGFLGPLITREKSIFLFDPLLVLTVIITAIAWRRFRASIKAYLIAVFLLLLAYICFYAKYTVWSGDFAWADRYVSTAVEFVAFISVPLLLRYRAELGGLVWRVGLGLIAVSTVIQIASLAFWLPLEIYQMETLGHPTFVIALRFRNIIAFALGKMDQWGLTNHAMVEDPWDYVHITTWNFLPFVLRRAGQAPRWVVNMACMLWSLALVALGWILWQLRRSIDNRDADLVAPLPFRAG
jgi:hypothetical protein